MSTTKSDKECQEGELDRVAELACDEALFGLQQAHARELDEAGDDANRLRSQLALVTSGLALREVSEREPLPANVRSRVQAQAFGFFERQGRAPTPTATTTGANVVELEPARVISPKPGNRWVGVLALAACFAAITMTVRWKLQPEPSPATAVTPAPTGPLLAGPLKASRLGATAELGQPASKRELSFSMTRAPDRRLPSDTWLWLRVEQTAGPSWQRIALIQTNSEGTASLVFDPGETKRVLAFAVAAPRPADPAMPDLEHAELEASVGD